MYVDIISLPCFITSEAQGVGFHVDEREGVGGLVGEGRAWAAMWGDGMIWINIYSVLITLGSHPTASHVPFLLFLLKMKLLM